MIEDVPTIAIELVSIIKNTSCLNDEMICHRIGLVPLRSVDQKKYNFREECGCVDSEENCEVCSVKFEIDVENKTKSILNVYADSIKNMSNNNIKPVSYKVNNKDL